MTMDLSPSEAEYLTGTLFEKSDPVTYHTLSRALNIHHTHAKEILYGFYLSNKDKLSANFLVVGSDHDGNTSIKVRDEDSIVQNLSGESASAQESFKKIHSIHVYCLKKKDVSISDTQLAIHESKFPVDYQNLDLAYENGMIKVAELSINSQQPVARDTKKIPTASTTTTRDIKSENKKSDSGDSKTSQVSAGLSSGYVSRKADTKKPVTADITSRYTSRKAEKAKTAPATQNSSTASTPSTGYQYKSRKAEKLQPKERVIVSHDTQDEPEEVDAPKKSANSAELQKLFEDDDSDFSDDDAAAAETKEPIIIHSMEEEKKQAEPAAAAAAVVAPAQEQDESTPAESKSLKDSVRPLVEESQEEQNRNVSVKQEEPEPEVESYVDEDGYLVTVNKSKKPAPAAPASRPIKRASSPAATNTKDPKKKKTGQSSLLNFFKTK